METYMIDGKRIAARSLAQAMIASRKLILAETKARLARYDAPLSPEEEQKARRTQFHAK